jgi:hypothetical protein
MLKWVVVPVNMLDTHTNSNHNIFWSTDTFLLTKKEGKKENARHAFNNWRRINKKQKTEDVKIVCVWSDTYNFIIINSFPILFYIIIQK